MRAYLPPIFEPREGRTPEPGGPPIARPRRPSRRRRGDFLLGMLCGAAGLACLAAAGLLIM